MLHMATTLFNHWKVCEKETDKHPDAVYFSFKELEIQTVKKYEKLVLGSLSFHRFVLFSN